MPAALITDWDQVPIMVPIALSAATVNVSRSTFYGLLERGEVRSKRVGGRVFVPKVELQRYCEGSTRRAS